MRRRQSNPARPFDHISSRDRLALLAGLLCITACESSQLLLITPAAVSPRADGARALLARCGQPVTAPPLRGLA